MPAGTTTIYAKWGPLPQTLIYAPNGATGGTMTNESRLTDSTDPLKKNAYVRTGYEFIGWSNTADGAVVYADEAVFTMPAGTTTIYAQWAPKRDVQ